MKRLTYLAVLFFALCATTAQAHVLLTTAYNVTGPLGVTTCSAPHATATSWTPITNGETLVGVTITYSLGTATFTGGSDNGWTTAACAPTYILTLNFSSGLWTLTIIYGGQSAVVGSGQMAGVTLSTALSNYQNANAHQFNNDADQFLAVTGTGLLPVALGTQPATW